MNIAQIENQLAELIKNFNEETFIYDLLLAYNLPKATITRLQKGTANLSKVEGEVSLKKKLFFKEVYNEDLHLSITNIVKEIKHNQRFVIVTDYKTVLAKDTKMGITLDIPLTDLPKNYDFFLPWAGMEKAQHQDENPADIKAAVKMAKLFDEIKSDNTDNSPEFLHSLNIFLSRLLFCFFAEDSEIFEDNQFSNAIASHTQKDGSDLKKYLDTLFEVLNTPKSKRTGLPEYLNAFPYVNGGLFAEKHGTPNFSSVSRKAIIESGSLSWADINPDIFGSMFQAVNHADARGTLGQHFTSVPNIMKVIEPLFLNDLKKEFENARGNNKKLNQLLYRLKNIKIFDPACGSGNFLIIAYKELRRLEMEIFKEMGSLALSEISLSQFYGIEIDDFAHEIAILALWLTKHQMNVEFFKEFGRTNPTLPLIDAGNIVQGNACRLDWEEVCPKGKDDEIYILGNPPYLGARTQNSFQKEDVTIVFGNIKGINSLDYITCWFFKGAMYIQSIGSSACSFVSTNSICQGEQVSLFWPNILKLGIEISFAHKPFIWTNNAKNKAAVYVVIIGVRNNSSNVKTIFYDGLEKKVKNISPYLTDNNNTIVYKKSSPPIGMPQLVYGNQAIEGGFLIMSKEEKEAIVLNDNRSSKFFRPLYGAEDFMKNQSRWCLWIKEEEVDDALLIDEIKERINNVRKFRSTGGQVAKSLVTIPYRFRYIHGAKSSILVLPRTASERREYIPVGFMNAESVITDAAQVIYDPEPYIFSLLSSKIHITWVKAVAGRLKMDPRYSNSLCYNAFPFPLFSKQRKEELTQCTLNIIDERLKRSEKTLAQLYDPDKMPEGLREVHLQNDLAVERCYRSTPFSSDEERLEYLFKLYEKMIQEEKDKDSLFAKEKKTRKRK